MTSSRARTASRLAIPLAGCAISVAAVWLALRGVDLARMASLFGQLRLGPLGLVGAAVAAQLWVRSVRWSCLLPRRDDGGAIPARRLVPVVLVGYLGNAVLPARLGDPIRAALVGRREGIPISTAFGSVVLERAIDTLTLAVIALPAAIWGRGARLVRSRGRAGGRRRRRRAPCRPDPAAAPGRRGARPARPPALAAVAPAARPVPRRDGRPWPRACPGRRRRAQPRRLGPRRDDYWAVAQALGSVSRPPARWSYRPSPCSGPIAAVGARLRRHIRARRVGGRRLVRRPRRERPGVRDRGPWADRVRPSPSAERCRSCGSGRQLGDLTRETSQETVPPAAGTRRPVRVAGRRSTAMTARAVDRRAGLQRGGGGRARPAGHGGRRPDGARDRRRVRLRRRHDGPRGHPAEPGDPRPCAACATTSAGGVLNAMKAGIAGDDRRVRPRVDGRRVGRAGDRRSNGRAGPGTVPTSWLRAATCPGGRQIGGPRSSA